MKRSLVFLCFLSLSAFAQAPVDPVWWSQGNPPVTIPGAEINNKGAANIGQAKYMAKSALEALAAISPTLSSSIEADLVGPGKVIESFAVPPNPTAEWLQSQKAPLLIGQLKAISAPFYNRLHTASPEWLETQRKLNGTNVVGTHLPWKQNVHDQNMSMATIGQLKAVFALRFEDFPVALTFEQWIANFYNTGDTNADPNADTDGDGITNIINYQNYLLFLGDIDADGIADEWDADPYDKDISWMKKHQPMWSLIEIPTDQNQINHLLDVSFNGTVLFRVHESQNAFYNGGYRIMDRSAHLHYLTLEPLSPAVGKYAREATSLVDDKVIIYNVMPYNDYLSSVESLWDPITDEVIEYPIPIPGSFTIDNYADGILDSQDGLQIRKNYSSTHGLWVNTDNYIHGHVGSISEHSKIVTQASETSDSTVRVWNAILNESRWVATEDIETYPTSLPTLATVNNAKYDQVDVVAAFQRLYTAKNFGSYNESDVGEGYMSSAGSWIGVTDQGWAVANTNLLNTSDKCWANGHWYDLPSLLGKIDDSSITMATCSKIRCNGVGVGSIIKPGESEKTYALMVPVRIEELAPKLVDENDKETPHSERALALPQANAMVERDPLGGIQDASTQRIAWREIKINVGKYFKNKTVTWSMKPMFTPHVETSGGQTAPDPTGPRFRGKWIHAKTIAHKQSFSDSQKYGAYGYKIKSETNDNIPGTATTTVDDEGFTAIRVNVPPIGFNKARVMIQLEGAMNTIDLIDLEVAAIIVIDPGHGTGGFNDGSAEGSVGLHTNVTEGDSALDIGIRTLNEIARIKDEKGLLVKKYSTKPNHNPRINIGLNDREEKARKFGADTFVSLHFDGATTDPNDKKALYRNPFGMIDQDDTKWNRNPRADWALALRVRKAVQSAIAAVEPAESIQASVEAYDEWDATHSPDAERVTSEINEKRLQKGLGALNDGSNPEQENGNYRSGDVRYTPCRATLIEMERTANEQADNLFNGNTAYNASTGAITLTALAESMRARVAIHIAEACIDDVLIRDLANQADVPVRTDPIPKLDFEGN
jgi:N-acetylmuramoyl-L-alanine amidase